MNWRCRIGWHRWVLRSGPFGPYRVCTRTPEHR